MYSKINLYMITIVKILTLTVLTSFIIVSPIYSQTAKDYNNSGNAKHDLKDYKGAIADYNKAIKINPKDSEAYYFRGVAKYRQQDYKAAIADYSKAIELDPKNDKAYHFRGIAKGALGDYRGAIQDYNKAIELNPQ